MTEGSDHPIEFLASFADLDDPRQQAKVLYPLEEILLLCLCAVISGADCWVEVALYGQQRLAFLRRFLPFKHGVPSMINSEVVFARLDAEQFQSCFIARLTATRGGGDRRMTLRRSFHHAAGQGDQMISVECPSAAGAGSTPSIRQVERDHGDSEAAVRVTRCGGDD